jgi:peptide/nickel transport system permease protein
MSQIETTTRLTGPPDVITGVQLMRGIGAAPAKGFWADAWSQVLRRRAAAVALAWVAVVVTCAIFAPLLASGHPLLMREIAPDGSLGPARSPWLRYLSAVDVILLLGGVAVPIAWLTGGPAGRAGRMRVLLIGIVAALAVTVPVSIIQTALAARDVPRALSWLVGLPAAPLVAGLLSAAAVVILGLLLPLAAPAPRRLAVLIPACLAGAVIAAATWGRPLERYNYIQRELDGEVRATYTLIPWSPTQRFSELGRFPPGTTLGAGLGLSGDARAGIQERTFYLGTDAFGSDVLTQVLHGCRLSISIGLVSTGIALLIGVTMGALMGYFGGWVDLVLYRVVEIFMAVPVLFLLIVAVSVVPRELQTTYTLMAIIGCFTWTGMARFTRAEFLKLRNQDFVQSARAVGLPLRSVLFRHMLPNGVAPVLVDTSFAVAAAITIEAVLSYLGLGPVDQASWGKLLASAMSSESQFKWWLAVFPGVAIFLTVLSYNLIGEALRDAIDPKLKKARV